MRKIYFVLLLLPCFAMAQDSQNGFGIKFTGFVRSDFFYDTRQVIYPTSLREGDYLLFPSNISKDANCKDVNAVGNFNFLSIQSRLSGAITGPDAFGAKTSGLIEADFFANENANLDDINGFRLRHAFVKMNWTKTELLAGQYWNPMFPADNVAAVISCNGGAPFQAFSRNPQLRLSRNFTPSLKLIDLLKKNMKIQNKN